MPRASGFRPALLLPLLALAACGAAAAQVHRCVAADGSIAFTDRRCQDIGAVERLPPAAAADGSSHLRRNACPRHLQDLVYELTTAIDSNDVNRLAGLYQWTGLSTRSGYALMQRLEAIARRPLVDIVPVYPPGAADEGDYFAQTTVRRQPVGLRLEQRLANGSTPSHTVLELRRAFGCWWVRL